MIQSERLTSRALLHPGRLHLGYFQRRISAVATDVRRFNPPDLPDLPVGMQTRLRACGHINSPVVHTTADFSVLVNFIPRVDAFTSLLNVCRKKAFIYSESCKKGKK